MEDFLSINEASKFLGISEKTLRIWDNNNKLPADKTEGGHRRYSPSKLRDFFKKNEISIYDEFIKADLNHTRDLSKDIFNFWKEKGYVKDGEEVLAIWLNNELSMYGISSNEEADEDFYLTIIRKIYDKLMTKNLIKFDGMLGPTGLIYYCSQSKKCLTIKNHTLTARTKKLNTAYLPGTKEIKIINLDKKTFEPMSVECQFNNIGFLQKDEIIELNAEILSNEIDKEIINDMYNNSTYSKDGNIKNLPLCENGYILTNEIGIKILKVIGLDKNDEIFFRGRRVYSSPHIDTGFLYCDNIFDGLNSKYFYNIYVPLILTPRNVNGMSWMIRYDKFIAYDFPTHYKKVLF